MENLSLSPLNYFHFHCWRNCGAMGEGPRLRSHNCQGAGLCINPRVWFQSCCFSRLFAFLCSKSSCNSSLKGHALSLQDIIIKNLDCEHLVKVWLLGMRWESSSVPFLRACWLCWIPGSNWIKIYILTWSPTPSDMEAHWGKVLIHISEKHWSLGTALIYQEQITLVYPQLLLLWGCQRHC